MKNRPLYDSNDQVSAPKRLSREGAWFPKEINSVKLQSFFEFCPVDSEVNLTGLPGDYVEYMNEYGASNLFRCLTNGWYNMYVFAPTAEGISNGLFKCGQQINKGSVYCFRHSGIWELVSDPRAGCKAKVWKDFHSWFTAAVKNSRRIYSPEEWQRTLVPAPPFTEEETRMVAARGKFSFRKHSAANGKLLVEVCNNSTEILQRLTVGIQIPEGLSSSTGIDVSKILPGESMLVEVEIPAYMKTKELVELFERPAPRPQDRPYYHEFREFNFRS